MSLHYNRVILILALLSLIGGSTPNRQELLTATDNSSGNQNSEAELYQKAVTHLNNSDFYKAEAILRPFTEKHPELAGPWTNLGLIQLKHGNLAEAEKLFRSALTKNPNFPQALNLLGLVETKKGDILQAKKLYSQAIEQNDDYAIAHYNLALLYDIYLQDIKSAVPHYQRYLELINYSDEATANWLEELKSTLKRDAS